MDQQKDLAAAEKEKKQKERDEYYKEWLRKYYPNSAEERIKSIFRKDRRGRR